MGCGWWARSPDSFHADVSARARGWRRWHRVYKNSWREAMHGCGLLSVRDHVEYIPQVAPGPFWPNVDVLHVRLAAGQTPEVFSGKGEQLRHVFGVHRMETRTASPGWVSVRVVRRNP